MTGYGCVLFYSSDDIDHRSSQTNISQPSSVPFAPPQMQISASMPWLGNGQTSMGASVVRVSALKTQIHMNTTQQGSFCYEVPMYSQQGDTKLYLKSLVNIVYLRSLCSLFISQHALLRFHLKMYQQQLKHETNI